MVGTRHPQLSSARLVGPSQAASLVGLRGLRGGQGRARLSSTARPLHGSRRLGVSHTRSARQGPLAAARRVMVMFRLSNICNTSLG